MHFSTIFKVSFWDSWGTLKCWKASLEPSSSLQSSTSLMISSIFWLIDLLCESPLSKESSSASSSSRDSKKIFLKFLMMADCFLQSVLIFWYLYSIFISPSCSDSLMESIIASIKGLSMKTRCEKLWREGSNSFIINFSEINLHFRLNKWLS